MPKFTPNSLSLTVPTFALKLRDCLQAIGGQAAVRNYPSLVDSPLGKFTVNFAVFVAEGQKQVKTSINSICQNLRLLSDERSASWARKFYIAEALQAGLTRRDRGAQVSF